MGESMSSMQGQANANWMEQLGDNEHDKVNSPSHYNQGDVECIDGLKAALGDGFAPYLRGNIMKYLWRCEHKGRTLEDLEKAQKYLGWLIEVKRNES